MKKIYNLFSIIIASIFIISCNDYLDPNEYGLLTDKEVYTITTYVNSMTAGDRKSVV